MGKTPELRIWSVVRVRKLKWIVLMQLESICIWSGQQAQSLYRYLYFRGIMDYSGLSQMRQELTSAKTRQVLTFGLDLFVERLPLYAQRTECGRWVNSCTSAGGLWPRAEDKPYNRCASSLPLRLNQWELLLIQLKYLWGKKFQNILFFPVAWLHHLKSHLSIKLVGICLQSAL